MEKCIYSLFPEAEVSVLHCKATDLICFIALHLSSKQGWCVPKDCEGVMCLDDQLDTGPCGIRSVSWAGAGGGVALLQEARVQVLKAQLPAILAPLRPVVLR